MAGAARAAARHARPSGRRSRLRLWLVLPLGARARCGAGARHRRLRENAGARRGGHAGCGDRLSARGYGAALPGAMRRSTSPTVRSPCTMSRIWRDCWRRCITPWRRTAGWCFRSSTRSSPPRPIRIGRSAPTAARPGRSMPISSKGRASTDWLKEGVVKQHRTLGTYLTLLRRNGFTIAEVEEWGPSDAQIAARPSLADERERPPFPVGRGAAIAADCRAVGVTGAVAASDAAEPVSAAAIAIKSSSPAAGSGRPCPAARGVSRG